MEKLLIKLNACTPAKKWASGKDWPTIYATCEQADWLLWLFARTNPNDQKVLTLAKGLCANTVRNFMEDERSLKAVDESIAFGKGEIGIEELDRAAKAAYAICIYSDIANGVAIASAMAAAIASDTSASASTVAIYAEVANDVANGAFLTNSSEHQKLMADIVRKTIPIDLWDITIE